MIFVMRLLGVGLNGLNTFVSLMDLSKSMSTNMYYAAVDNIFISVSSVFNEIIQKAGREENEKNTENGKEKN